MIINEDCIEGMKKLADNSVQLVFADPPFNIGGKSKQIKSSEKNFQSISEEWDTIENFTEFNRSWLSESYRILQSGGSILVWGTRHNLFEVGVLLEEMGFDIRCLYVWYKTNAMPNLTGRAPSESTEFCIWATKGAKWTYNLEYAKSINEDKNIRNVFIVPMTPPNEKTHGKHPSQKRLDGLTEDLLMLHSHAGDTVVIPFAGSGTEILACQQNNREYIAYELETDYIDLINRRLGH